MNGLTDRDSLAPCQDFKKSALSPEAVHLFPDDNLGLKLKNIINSLGSLEPTFFQIDAIVEMLSIAGRSVLHQARTQLRPSAGRPSVQSLSAFGKLISSLAVLEQRDGKLLHGSSSAVTAAQKLGGPITGFVAGSNIKSIAEEAAKIAGVDKIIAVENEAYDKACLGLRFERT